MNHPKTTGFIPYEDNLKSPDRYNYKGPSSETHSIDGGNRMLKKLSNETEKYSMDKLNLKHKPESMPPDFPTKRKPEKEKFG